MVGSHFWVGCGLLMGVDGYMSYHMQDLFEHPCETDNIVESIILVESMLILLTQVYKVSL